VSEPSGVSGSGSWLIDQGSHRLDQVFEQIDTGVRLGDVELTVPGDRNDTFTPPPRPSIARRRM
jgi:hypothetical protein